ncbi:MAG TPA: DUF6326 family protein [Candidatus Dormibacteraeota bacterium]|nr:DUF6326 family protein [Candidatus Dormibacteraeota bacterium]
MKTRLSTLWIFATLNYLYCDVVTLMDPKLLKGFLAGNVGGMDVSQVFLLAAGALVEIPIAMVLLSRVLDDRSNRWANVVAGAVMTVVQLSSLFARTPAPYYVFFSAFEIGATVAIVWLAWRWRDLGARDLAPAMAVR